MIDFLLFNSWLIGAAIIGFLVSFIFADWLGLSRKIFLIFYVVAVVIFILIYVIWSNLDFLAFLFQNWIWGLIVGAIIGALLVKNVFSQSKTKESESSSKTVDILWLGLVYGIIDALFLNVMPVLITWEAFSFLDWTSSILGGFVVILIGLGGSLFVTFFYHIGYKEFRNSKIKFVFIGNTLITLAFLISFSPLGAIISHTAMHIAATIKGPETTIQLPPHKKQ
jgi:hypothetical protein